MERKTKENVGEEINIYIYQKIWTYLTVRSLLESDSLESVESEKCLKPRNKLV